MAGMLSLKQNTLFLLLFSSLKGHSEFSSTKTLPTKHGRGNIQLLISSDKKYISLPTRENRTHVLSLFKLFMNLKEGRGGGTKSSVAPSWAMPCPLAALSKSRETVPLSHIYTLQDGTTETEQENC